MDLPQTQSVLHSGLSLIHSGQSRSLRAASDVLNGGPGRMADGAAEFVRAKLEVQAGAKLVRLADENLGNLLEILA